MKRLALGALCALALASTGQAATFTYTGSPFTNVMPYSGGCPTGVCANFTTSMRVTGSITTSAPLAPNLANQDVTAQVTAYSFSDGVNTFASSDPNVKLYYPFMATTDASGNLTAMGFLVNIWETGTTNSHAGGDRLSNLAVAATGAVSYNDIPCATVGVSPTGAADSCTFGGAFDNDISYALTMAAGTWASTGNTSAVPTLSQWGTALLALTLSIVAGFGFRAGRQR